MDFSCYEELTQKQKQEIINRTVDYVKKHEKIFVEKLEIIIYLLKSLEGEK